MKPKAFINQLDDAKIVDAIARAEQQTSGEIRVFISTHQVPEALPAAKQQFTRMGMEKTAERNAVLIYLAPESQSFALVGDVGIHAKCGEEFWKDATTEMQTHFKTGDFTGGLLAGIRKVGESLARHFPHRNDDRNELPNDIERD